MSGENYRGSCQCGAVRFRATIDFSFGTSRCNCSICRNSRFWKVMVPEPDFELISGENELAEYRFASRSIAHMFCTHCGVKIFGELVMPDTGPLVAINVMCLDDVSDQYLAPLPVEYEDGKHDRQDQAPEITSYL